MRRALLFAIVAGCAGAPVERPSPPVVVPSAQPSAEPTSVEEPSVDLQTLVCKAQPGCRIVAIHDAGEDAAHQKLSVALAWLGRASRGPAAQEPTPAGIQGFAHDGELDLFDVTGLDCQTFQYWLVTGTVAAPQDARMLVEICNDGHGAAGVGMDYVTVADNRFGYKTMGGSSWRWSYDSNLRLSPLSLLDVEETASWTGGYNMQASRWSWERFAGDGRWYAPHCGDETVEPTEELTYAFVTIPDVALDAATADAWKVTALGSCAAHVDGRVLGTLLRGRADAASALLAVVTTDGGGTVFVEVHDDHFTPATAAVQDELEIWADGVLPDYSVTCLDPAPPPRGAVLRVADGQVGQVPKSSGSPLADAASAGAPHDGEPARFRFELDADAVGSLSVLYRDSDDGRSVARVLATSRLDPRNRASLGAVRILDPAEAVCEARAGSLEARVLAAKAPAGAGMP